ncbi:putative membrane protein [Sesbania bispinosa]|nr:putative membrane protein [Sesbania bispinosa]
MLLIFNFKDHCQILPGKEVQTWWRLANSRRLGRRNNDGTSRGRRNRDANTQWKAEQRAQGRRPGEHSGGGRTSAVTTAQRTLQTTAR